MFGLLLDGAKLIMMFGLIGSIIVLSHFGKQPVRVRRARRGYRPTCHSDR